MHGKESVIQPLLERSLGVRFVQSTELNTDVFGTFSGEVERPFSPIETSRRKAQAAMSMVNCDLVVASEGSFGPHPTTPFLACNEELLYFLDGTTGQEIVAKEISLETNFAHAEVKDGDSLVSFLQQATFPSHGIIIKTKDGKILAKGVRSFIYLNEVLKEHFQPGKTLIMETDMRAFVNPMRMKVIEMCTHKLIETIQNTCPQCQEPGFSITRSERGLPCSICHFPTSSLLKYVYVCHNCQFEKERLFPLGKEWEEPMYCDHCNP